MHTCIGIFMESTGSNPINKCLVCYRGLTCINTHDQRHWKIQRSRIFLDMSMNTYAYKLCVSGVCMIICNYMIYCV